MADEIVAKYKVDVAEASKNLADLANASTKASDAMAKAGKVATDSFVAGSGGAKSFELAMKASGTTLIALNEKLVRLKEILVQDTKIGSEGFKQISTAIKATQNEIDRASGKMGSMRDKVVKAMRDIENETKKTNRELEKTEKAFLKNEQAIAKANAKLEEAKNKGVGVIGTFKNVAAAIGIAFGVQQIISFGKEAVQLAAKAEGVERAFARIGSPALLDGLRAATRGTVTDLVLMQNAVKASNFKIPLEQLGTLFQFAQSRARATGESVDYLVDSLILGIGRKSIPILDNLGISAVELKEKLGDTAKSAATIGDVAAAVGRIATESLQKTGIEADTTADKIAQLSTAWTNFKTNVGAGIIGFAANAANELGLLQADSKAVMEAISKLSEASTLSILRQIEAQKKIVADARETFDQASEDRLLKQGFDEIYAAAKKNSIVQSDILEEMERILKVRQQEILAANELGAVTADQLEAEKKRFELASKDGGEIRNVFFLTAAIKDLNDTINDEATAREAIMPLIKQRIELQKELDALINAPKTGIDKLNEEMSALTKELNAAEVGSQAMFAILDKIAGKQSEIDFAKALVQPLRDSQVVLEEIAAKELAEFEKQQAAKLALLKEYNGLVEQLADELAVTSNEVLDRESQKIRDNADLRRQLAFEAASEGGAAAERYSQTLLEIDASEKAELEKQQADHNERIFGLNKELADKTADLAAEEEEAKQAQLDKELQMASYYVQAVSDVFNTLSQAIIQGYDNELAALQQQLDNGQISQEKFDQERRRLLRKKAIEEKNFAIFSAILNTASAVIQAANAPFPLNIALPILAGVLGAAQIAIIAAQPLPSFAKGVIGLQGEGTETSDSIHARLSKGESVMTAKETREHLPILTAIRKGTIEKLIQDSYVTPAINAALLNGFGDIGKSAELNGLTANLKDHNIIAALDRVRQSNTYGLAMLAEKMGQMKAPKRGGYA